MFKDPARSHLLLAFALLVWGGLVVFGLSRVWIYANSPGANGDPPASWPDGTAITRNGLPTLLVFIHPHCPCSRATIGELAVLMAHVRGKVEAHVLFVKPKEFGEEWAKTDLFESALAIPGVTVSIEESGAEALRFHSTTSGQVILYDSQGRLTFCGGITAGRGHFGDNPGRLAIESLLNGRQVGADTSVFGCPLQKDQSKKHPEAFCSGEHHN